MSNEKIRVLGWNAPRKSLLLVHPDGEGSRVDNASLNISFDPPPDYAGIVSTSMQEFSLRRTCLKIMLQLTISPIVFQAAAASSHTAHAARVMTTEELEQMLPKMVEKVIGGTTAVLDVHINAPTSF